MVPEALPPETGRDGALRRISSPGEGALTTGTDVPPRGKEDGDSLQVKRVLD